MRILPVPGKRDTDGAGIRVENASNVRVIGNIIEDTDGFGLVIGRGANHNGAPSLDVRVESNIVRGGKLLRLGSHHSGLTVNHNQYAVGEFVSDQASLKTRRLARWQQATGLDLDSTQEPVQVPDGDQEP